MFARTPATSARAGRAEDMDEEEMVVEVAADVGVLLVTQCSGCTPRKMEYWGGPLGALFPPAGHSPRAPSALRATLTLF